MTRTIPCLFRPCLVVLVAASGLVIGCSESERPLDAQSDVPECPSGPRGVGVWDLGALPDRGSPGSALLLRYPGDSLGYLLVTPKEVCCELVEAFMAADDEAYARFEEAYQEALDTDDPEAACRADVAYIEATHELQIATYGPPSVLTMSIAPLTAGDFSPGTTDFSASLSYSDRDSIEVILAIMGDCSGLTDWASYEALRAEAAAAEEASHSVLARMVSGMVTLSGPPSAPLISTDDAVFETSDGAASEVSFSFEPEVCPL